MSRKKTSRAGNEPAKTEPSDSAGSDGVANPTDLIETSATADDQSAGAIPREGDEGPPEIEADANAESEVVRATASIKEQGSKTLMGFRLDALTLAAFRTAPTEKSEVEITEEKPSEEIPLPLAINVLESKASHDEGPRGDSPLPTDNEPTLVIEAKMLTNKSSDGDTQVTSLLEEVAQALNLQAGEYRDRARGKLPGMSVASPAAAGPAVLGSSDLEFEDADEPTALTPGIKFGSLRQTRGGFGGGLDSVDADDEAVVLGPASTSKSPAAGTDTKSSRLPPIPGLSGSVTAGPVGPHPGSTPASGLSLSSSGRVRLPTPPGSVTIPPPSGRLSLPPGMMSAPAIPGRSSMSLDPSVIAAARDSSSRRVLSPPKTPGPGPTTKRRTAHVTQPVLDAARAMPAVLAAHVKIATVSLAGLIAVTFAGGLLVGMLVWRGQGRAGVEASPATASAGTEAIAPAPAAGLAAPPKLPTAVVLPVGGAGLGAGAAAGAPRPPAVAGATTEAIVTPIAAQATETAPLPPPRRAMATPPRVRRPTPTPTVADTASLFPKSTVVAAKPAAPAAPATAKTVASNAPAKAPPKSKVKTAWHDPFAD